MKMSGENTIKDRINNRKWGRNNKQRKKRGVLPARRKFEILLQDLGLP